MQASTFFGRIRAFFTRKKIIWTIVIIVILGGIFLLSRRGGGGANIQTGTVTREDIKKTVLTTGEVVSQTDLSLSFQSSGVVRNLPVKAGDKVYAGQTLAVLDQTSALASLESARASLAQAEASYEKTKSAATAQDIAVSQAAVNVAETALLNAEQNLSSELLSAYDDANTVVLSDTNNLFSNPYSPNPQFTISGTVQTNSQLVIDVNNKRVQVNNTLSEWKSKLSGISPATADTMATESLRYIAEINEYLTDILTLTTSYTQVSSSAGQTALTAAQTALSSAKATIDAAASAIRVDVQAVRTAQSNLAQTKASLALKQSPARPEDVSIAEAQVMAARSSVHSAEAALRNTVITAPIAGTITSVDIRLGEQAAPSKEVIKLLNVSELHAEADVSEADIASVEIGQTINYTFDAFGPDAHFEGKVLTIDPASTVISGVVNYKVTGSLSNIPGVKPGMTANMTILVTEKQAALVVPSSAVINAGGKKTVKVIDDPKKKTYHEVEVTTGLEADGGLTEITSGLSEGQSIVTYIK